MASANDICYGCRAYKEIVYTEQGTERVFCKECALQLPPASEDLARLFLSLTVPFKVGDKVLARQVIACEGGGAEPQFRTEGVGVVTDVSVDPRHGGTPVYPTFHVRIEEKEHDEAPDDGWYTEICLKKVSA